ncbi:putative vacuolar protein-sorting-associated protein [Phyllosticta citribraziliensis]|uniref:Vacuolar protein-sorting-associated protein n=1 Tax=Phyllosticta citribraziliensis TaxID=989973 RepID=A0ABR1LLI6_9PEZI
MTSTTPQPPYSPSPSSHLRTSSIPTTAASPYPAAANNNTSFNYPPHYSFPPFFTLQPVLSTRTSQLASWSAFIQSYCRHQRRFVLSLVDALDSDLFWNRRIGKRLSAQDARAVLSYMASAEGGYRAEWVDGAADGGGGGGGAGAAAASLVGGLGGAAGRGSAVAGEGNASGRMWIYWRRPEEWAGVLEGWVDATGQKNTVLTLYELTESDATASQEFHGMDASLLQKSLQVLVKRGKAQIFGSDDSLGVKFF